MGINILKTDIKKFTHVIHIADIHIRLTKRHEEYKEIFSRLFSELLKTPPTTAIFVLGDVVNSKIDLSPECVDLAADFLFELASIRPTILVAGNHDTNLTNRNRMDSLSPIVDAIKHPNLFYLKQSGLYGFGNICINNYSVFDSSDKYIRGVDIPKIYRNQYEYFITTYHGQVDGAITDLGFRLTNSSVTVGLFDKHDIVLMGDIHKEQNLQIYNKDEEKPAIRYGGSLIQQKHDESIKGHGYSFWNLKRRDYVHSDVPNDYGFFTILLDNGIISTPLNNLPKKARIRFQLKNTMPTEIKKALVDIRQLTDVVESCYQKLDSKIDLTKISTSNGNVILGNINDKNYQIDLIKEFLKNKLKITNEDFIDGIIKINDEINNSIKKDDFSRNIRWVPIKFEWSNMFSYGEKNTIDFTKTKNLIGMFASNTSGKSSVFSAMTFCLFDKCEREYKAVNIMNVKKTEFSCKFEFEIDGKRYFIQRNGKADKKSKVKVDVRFWKVENGQEIDLNGEQRKDTNEIIREYLGSYDDFILTSLSVQNGKNNSSIIDMGDTDRKDLFSKFMGLEIFDRLYTEANERMREQIVILRTYKNDDYTQKLVDYTNLLSQAENLYKDESKILTEINKNKENIQQLILAETKKLIKLDQNIPPISESESLRERTIKWIENSKRDIFNSENKIKLLSEKLEIIESDIVKLESKHVDVVYKTYQTFLEKKKDINNEKEKIKLNYENDIKICQKAELIEYDPSCSYCVKNTGRIAIEAEEAKTRIIKLKENALSLKKEEDFVDTQITELSWSFDANINHMKFLKIRNDLKDKQLFESNLLNKSRQSLIIFEEEIKIYERNIELYNKNSVSVKANEEINNKIDLYTKSLSEISYLYKTKNKVVMDINSKISVCKNQISEINCKIDQIKTVEQQYKLYEAYCQSVSRDGIPFEIITATVPEIQNEVNNILSQVTDFESLFETDGKNIIPYIVYGDKKWLMNLTSGFEKFALSLAIRVSLINLSNLPRPNFLILDEPFGVLDAENLSSMDTFFSYLKTFFDFIIIISHIDSVKDIVDDNIEIKKENGVSKIEFV